MENKNNIKQDIINKVFEQIMKPYLDKDVVKWMRINHVHGEFYKYDIWFNSEHLLDLRPVSDNTYDVSKKPVTDIILRKKVRILANVVGDNQYHNESSKYFNVALKKFIEKNWGINVNNVDNFPY